MQDTMRKGRRVRCSRVPSTGGQGPRGAAGWRVGESVEVERDGLYYVCRISQVDASNKRCGCAPAACAHEAITCAIHMCAIFVCSCACARGGLLSLCDAAVQPAARIPMGIECRKCSRRRGRRQSECWTRQRLREDEGSRTAQKREWVGVGGDAGG